MGHCIRQTTKRITNVLFLDETYNVGGVLRRDVLDLKTSLLISHTCNDVNFKSVHCTIRGMEI